MICHNSEMKKQSGFEVLKDHKTGKEYLYRNGIIINRETGEQIGKN